MRPEEVVREVIGDLRDPPFPPVMGARDTLAIWQFGDGIMHCEVTLCANPAGENVRLLASLHLSKAADDRAKDRPHHGIVPSEIGMVDLKNEWIFPSLKESFDTLRPKIVQTLAVLLAAAPSYVR